MPAQTPYVTPRTSGEMNEIDTHVSGEVEEGIQESIPIERELIGKVALTPFPSKCYEHN